MHPENCTCLRRGCELTHIVISIVGQRQPHLHIRMLQCAYHLPPPYHQHSILSPPRPTPRQVHTSGCSVHLSVSVQLPSSTKSSLLLPELTRLSATCYHEINRPRRAAAVSRSLSTVRAKEASTKRLGRRTGRHDTRYIMSCLCYTPDRPSLDSSCHRASRSSGAEPWSVTSPCPGASLGSKPKSPLRGCHIELLGVEGMTAEAFPATYLPPTDTAIRAIGACRIVVPTRPPRHHRVTDGSRYGTGRGLHGDSLSHPSPADSSADDA